ncbi:hypothetical protein C8Q72DRAFT_858653 [Fomitopsis betulina]|nr:hypothetical protein C8Q72DRAFT_858653 [Fomitopsis betulina]
MMVVRGQGAASAGCCHSYSHWWLFFYLIHHRVYSIFSAADMAGNRVARPLPKRRRLASAPFGRKSSSTLTSELTEQHLDTLAGRTALCTSCHRNLAQRLIDVVRCARCRETTCLVCSRTCSAPPLILPPTPALTRSTTPTPCPSPRRTALALSTNSRTTNGMLNTLPSARGYAATGKRRKPHSLDADDSEHASCSSDDEKAGKHTSHGCGRIVCRKCCHENPSSATTTCYDCLNQLYNTPTQLFDARNSH